MLFEVGNVFGMREVFFLGVCCGSLKLVYNCSMEARGGGGGATHFRRGISQSDESHTHTRRPRDAPVLSVMTKCC